MPTPAVIGVTPPIPTAVGWQVTGARRAISRRAISRGTRTWWPVTLRTCSCGAAVWSMTSSWGFSSRWFSDVGFSYARWFSCTGFCPGRPVAGSWLGRSPLAGLAGSCPAVGGRSFKKSPAAPPPGFVFGRSSLRKSFTSPWLGLPVEGRPAGLAGLPVAGRPAGVAGLPADGRSAGVDGRPAGLPVDGWPAGVDGRPAGLLPLVYLPVWLVCLPLVGLRVWMVSLQVGSSKGSGHRMMVDLHLHDLHLHAVRKYNHTSTALPPAELTNKTFVLSCVSCLCHHLSLIFRGSE